MKDMDITHTQIELTPAQVRSLAGLSTYTDSDVVHLKDTPGMLSVTLVEGVFVILPDGDVLSMHDEELIPVGNLGIRFLRERRTR